ncbi:metallo-hydrolase oxidoreductase [Fusarium sp. NRRL 52700]|nr:metallo-hydrolase oxidoreductase [Fusarium sp. NRRL 52700]
MLPVGTATTIIEWEKLLLLTYPNFLHAGDHVHLGPGVTAERQTNPAVDLHELPSLDAILLSHYHEDQFDRLVEDSLNRDFLIVTTPHAHRCLTSKNEPFHNVEPLDFFDHLELKSEDSKADKLLPVIKVTAMPGKHIPSGPLAAFIDLLGAVPPTNGWMLGLGYRKVGNGKLQASYRIHISGDTLLVDELKEIPRWLQNERIDLMLIHLGGTTIPGPSAPLIMVTLDAKQGVELMKMMVRKPGWRIE